MLIPYTQLIQKYNIRPTGVLHIGASVGQEAPDYYQNGVQRSIWCEADPELIPKLLHHLQIYPDSLVFNDCITDVDGDEVTFHRANNEGQSSSILQLADHKVQHPEVHYVQDIKVKTKRVDTLMRENFFDIEQYPFVNIDVQGAEGLVLKGFGELLHKVQYLYIEVNEANTYDNCMQLPEMKAFLHKFGFIMREKVMCGIWGDCLFTK